MSVPDLAPEPCYRLYGLTVQSAFPFRFKFAGSTDAPDLRFVYQGVVAERNPEGKEVAVRDGMRFFRTPAYETIVFPGIAAFECSPTEIRASAYGGGMEYLVEICLVGNVLAYWLERMGVCALHASAVMVDSLAVAFIAGTSRGKTTTACAFLAVGAALVTDDILPMEIAPGSITARPGFPQMKLLPEQLRMLGGDPEAFGKIHPLFEKLMVPIGDGIASYHGLSLPLGRIYLLDRVGEGDIAGIRLVSQGEALIELVRHSFLAELMDATDRGPGRLERLAVIARTVPMRRLRVPAGYGRLAEARQLVLADIKDGQS